MPHNPVLADARLAVVQRLRLLQPEVSQVWINLIYQKISDPYGKLSQQELSISTSQGISAILDALADGNTRAIEFYIEFLSQTRIRQDFSIQDITRALMLVRQVLLSYIRKETDDSSNIEQDLDEVLQALISRFAFQYAGALNQVLARAAAAGPCLERRK